MTENTADRFLLPQSMAEEIIDHARDLHPRECCGIVAGRNAIPVRVYRTTNVAPGNRLYEIDPRELIDLEFHELPAQDLEIVAIYHSHPSSEAYPSATDLELAFWPEAVYLICSLADLERPYIRGFRLRDGHISDVDLTDK
ncbi:MAG: M67 family metallopeptidase [Thermomicrobiales bacterium]